MTGLILLDHLAARARAEAHHKRWLAEARFKSFVDIEPELERLPKVLVRLLASGHRGKMAVRVA